MALIVKKFGGTSVAGIPEIKNVANIIEKEIKLGNQVIAVVSAMAGTTDNLINLAKQVSPLLTFQSLAEYDTVISSGEQITAGLLSLALQNKGIKSSSWLGWQLGLITNEEFSKANLLSIDKDKLLIEINNDKVPVVAGFQGVTTEGKITTFGRGTSDLTAVFLAASLKAERCDIYTDVDGIYTIDPKFINNAKKLNYIPYDTMIELSKLGAKVLEIKSIEMAKEHKVPVRVLSSFSENQGTYLLDNLKEKATGIAIQLIDNNNTQISIVGSKVKDKKILKENIVDILSDKYINLHDLKQTESTISFMVESNFKDLVINKIYKFCFGDTNPLIDKDLNYEQA